ncbi:MAG: GNAT family protein [Paracoccaceae bacterium]
MKRFGEPLGDWVAPRAPDVMRIEGRHVRLERLAEHHAHSLFRAYSGADPIWDYMPAGPFSSEAGFIRFIKDMAAGSDPYFMAVCDPATGAALGILSWLRITPAQGVIELGYICFSPALQRTVAASEALMLMIGWAFEAGYRRFEWKCDALNTPSRRAAQRLGLSYEGIFRQATHYKGRNRDTAWFAAIDKEWPALKEAYSAWLAPSNFDAEGRQIESLSDLTRLVRAASDPALGEG